MVIMMDETVILARAIINGVITLYALCIVSLFTSYIIITPDHKLRLRIPGWWRDPGVQAAASIALYALGIAVGSASRWAEHIATLTGSEFVGATLWIQYAISGLFITAGSILILIGFSPVSEIRLRGWGLRMQMRWWVLLVASLISVLVPVISMLLIVWFYQGN